MSESGLPIRFNTSTHSRSVLQLSSGSTSSLPLLKKLQGPRSTRHPLEKTTTKKGRVRRPSSAGAPPPLQDIQKEDMVAVGKGVEPGTGGWEYCSLPVTDEMSDCLAGQYTATVYSHCIQ